MSSSKSLLRIGPHAVALPVVHGSGDFSWEVRRIMNSHEFDCLAVPLPDSFQTLTENAIVDFPSPGIVVQRNHTPIAEQWSERQWNEDLDDEQSDDPTCLLYTSPSPRDKRQSRMPSSA